MLDNVHTADTTRDKTQFWRAIFRCDFCQEIISQRGPVNDLKFSKVIVHDTECTVICYECAQSKDFNGAYMRESYAAVTSFFITQIPTYDALNRAIEKSNLNGEQRIFLMKAAHFVGDRPEV